MLQSSTMATSANTHNPTPLHLIRAGKATSHADRTSLLPHPPLVYGARSYGYVTEVAYDAASGTTSAKKWYSLGRSAVEMGLVMPDQKTVRGSLHAWVQGALTTGAIKQGLAISFVPTTERLPPP